MISVAGAAESTLCFRIVDIILPKVSLDSVDVLGAKVLLNAYPVEEIDGNNSYAVSIESQGRSFLTKFSPISNDRTVTEVGLDSFQLSGGSQTIRVSLQQPRQCGHVKEWSMNMSVLPSWLSIFPPMIALIIAILTKNVVLSLASGVYFGCFLIYGYNPATAFARMVDTRIPVALGDPEHAIVIVFCWLLAGIVTMITKSGGGQGLAESIVRFGKTSVGAQMVTVLMGLMVFFDDYANILIVGNTLRPVTDRLRISREKFAFLVDCISAPIASIAPLSSWIGYELSLIDSEFKALGIQKNAFIAFLETIPYRFYPIYLVAFVVGIVFLQRDYGPMLTAELKARKSSQDVEDTSVEEEYNSFLKPKAGVVPKWYNGLLPIVVLIFAMFFGIILDGSLAIQSKDVEQRVYSIESIFAESNSFHVLMWSGVIGTIFPIILYAMQGILSPSESYQLWVEGMKDLMEPVLVLTLAWTLGTVVKDLHLAEWLSQILYGSVPMEILPTLVFLISGAISFCTGSSWSAMAILFPIVVPLAWNISNMNIEALVQNIASVLAGSVCGDHCSPISDTTLLTSISTKCSIPDHIKTQAPYAAVVGVASMICGSIPTAYFKIYTPAIALPVGVISLLIFIRCVGTHVPNYKQGSSAIRSPSLCGKDNPCLACGSSEAQYTNELMMA